MKSITLYPNDHESPSVRMSSGANPATNASTETASRLALSAVAGPILFTLAWIVLGFVSPGFTIFGTRVAPYSPISQPVSGLGLGVTAPFMNAAFVLSGLLVMTGAAGIFWSIREMSATARWSCIALLALSGLGMVLDGIFTLEAILPHTAGFLLGAGAPVVSFLVIGRSFPPKAIGTWSLCASMATRCPS